MSVPAILLGAVLVAQAQTPPAPAPSAVGGDLSVARGEGAEWVVSFKGQPVGVVVAQARPFKPYVKTLAPPGGRDLLRDAPFDHLHHHGLMYAIRADGVNFWEETPGAGLQLGSAMTSEVVAGEAGRPAAVLRQRVLWLRGDAGAKPQPMLIEDRTLTVTVDEASRETALVWRSAFQVPEESPGVTLTGSRYNGLGIRFRQDLDAVAEPFVDGAPVDLAGKADDNRPGAWGAMRFTPESPEDRATVVLAASPRNARHPSRYFTMTKPFSYLAATQGLDLEPLATKSGDRFTVEYLIVARPEVMSPEAIAARVASWTGSGQ